MVEYRAVFDAHVTFRNGGGLQVQGFRLDVAGPDVTEAELAALLVRHLGLLMVDQVRLSGVSVVAEPHRGSRGGPSDPATGPAPASGGQARRLVDLSHEITATYPGLPGPEITPHLTREEARARYRPGTEFAIDRISMVGNTGTYLDSPYHRFADGTDLAGLPLSAVADLPAVVVRLEGSDTLDIGPYVFDAVDVTGHAVLLHTGWDRHWGTPRYGERGPFLTGPAAQRLVDAGARLVGIDSVNIDDLLDPARPAHTILLRAGIPVLEHLTNLADLPTTGARLHAAPPALRGLGTFPVRAYAVVPG